MSAAPMHLLEAKVRPEWIDYNGHMNVAYYVLAFDAGTDMLMDHCGLNAAYREATGDTIYVLEAHILYLRELREAENYRLSVQLLAHDEKRIHCINFMHRLSDGELASTYEVMMLHVRQAADGPASAPFPASVQATVDALGAQHAALAAPEQAGRLIGIRKQGG